jgi:adenosylmethionine-8-amino-7-oxononanoate aminotransferase
VDALHSNGQLRNQPGADCRAWRGRLYLRQRWSPYLDALSGLFVVQAGYGRDEIADAADKQTRKLAYFPIWSYATPPAIELADRLAALAPGDLNKVFFSSGGGESVETAWKLAKQYFKLTGKPYKTKVISRAVAYHGTTQGALSITGVPNFKHAFEPLVPGSHRVPNTDFYRAPRSPCGGREDLWAVGREPGREAILAEGPDSIAAVFVEPVQNAAARFHPHPAISSGCARSATPTTCCWSPMR